jgi:hypothetical protein
MTEENGRRAEEVRHALGEFLDRLSKAVVDSLARSKRVGPSPRRPPARPRKGRTKSSE